MYGLKWRVCLLGLLVASCSKNGVEVHTDFCTYATPIYVGTGDVFTDDTAKQILNVDETWKSLCNKVEVNH